MHFWLCPVCLNFLVMVLGWSGHCLYIQYIDLQLLYNTCGGQIFRQQLAKVAEIVSYRRLNHQSNVHGKRGALILAQLDSPHRFGSFRQRSHSARQQTCPGHI